MEKMIEIKGLSFTYPGADQQSLKDIDLTVYKGEFVAVVGDNGSGKSTLCKALNGLIPHYHNGNYKGTVVVDGFDVAHTPLSVISQKVGFVYQDFDNQLVRSKVWDEIIFAPMNYGMRDYRERAEQILKILQLEPIQEEYIFHLSGGQKHLTALGSILSVDPDILILDEPAAQLDPANAKKVYDFLKILNERYEKTIIVIEHQAELINKYCSSVVLLEQGKKIWKKTAKESKQLFSEYRLYLEEKELGFCLQPLKNISRNQKETLRVENVYHGYKTFKNEVKPVLKGVNLTFFEGERIAVIGGNGCGKSTLLKLLTGIIKPTKGSIFVCGKDTYSMIPEELSEIVTYIYQNAEDMFIHDSIRKDIEYFLKVRDVPGVEELVDDILKRFSLNALSHRDGRLLSGGEQRRASIAIGAAMQSSIMLLDEPTSSLDLACRRDVMQVLDMLKDHIKTVVVATHDVKFIMKWATRVIVIKEGRIVGDSSTEQLWLGDEVYGSN